MKVQKTAFFDREIYKLKKMLANKTQLIEAGMEGYGKIIEQNPQALINEQKLFKVLDPEARNRIIKETNAKYLLNVVRRMFGGESVTKVVQKFFSHPMGIQMRFVQDDAIDFSQENFNNYISRIMRKELRAKAPDKVKKNWS